MIKPATWKPILKTATHLGALTPLALMLLALLTGNYGPNPIGEFTLRTGKTALILLLLTLACTPIAEVFQFRFVLRLRRPLGLYAYLYAAIHFAIFIGLDYGFLLGLIRTALLEKRYALAGLAAGLLMTPLAITSTRGWIRRLGKRWKQLHRLAYAAGLLAVTHYLWLVKPGVPTPWLYAGVLLVLFLLRVKPIQSSMATLFERVRASIFSSEERTS